MPRSRICAAPAGPAAVQPAVLSGRQRELLSCEQQYWRFRAPHEQIVRELFGVSLARYRRELVEIVTDPQLRAAAAALDPLLIRRLDRRLDRRHTLRAAVPDAGLELDSAIARHPAGRRPSLHPGN